MKVLLTGSTGYIGRRLKHLLLEKEDISLRLLTRNKNRFSTLKNQNIEIFEGDTLDKESLLKACKDVDIAYYLVHSLNSKDYKSLDAKSASNFIETAEEMGVKKVIYLGGLGVKSKDTSEHLLSRIQTGEILSSSKSVQTVWLRAGIIIGSGSASFEIIRNLTEKLPVMTTPKWVFTKAQPIAVEDVLKYLVSSLDLKLKENIILDIGSEQLSYKQMILATAEVLGLKRWIIPLPFLSINLSSYWLNLFTPIPFSISKALIEGLKSEVVIQNNNAKKLFPKINPISYNQSVKKAIYEIEQNQVLSRWSDNAGEIWDKRDISDALFLDRKEIDISNVSKEKLFDSITSIGGKNGWYAYDFLWVLRGFIDKLIGGYGLRRGRRDPFKLRIGESLDFWKVVDIKRNERLLLYAQMKIPGLAWLEFKIVDNKLIQTAYFYPKGLWGRIYWYILIPVHYFVFRDMITNIVNSASKKK
jgi:uncharacterized protein YbjT (DUF2867 family)